MEGSKHFQSAQLVQEMGTEKGTAVIALGLSPSTYRMRPRGAESNARLGEFAAEVKIAIGAMLAADIVAVAVLFSPLVGSADSRRTQILELKAELTKKTHEVAPLIGMDKKLVLAKVRSAISTRAALPPRTPNWLDELGKIARPMASASSRRITRRKTRRLPA